MIFINKLVKIWIRSVLNICIYTYRTFILIKNLIRFHDNDYLILIVVIINIQLNDHPKFVLMND